MIIMILIGVVTTLTLLASVAPLGIWLGIKMGGAWWFIFGPIALLGMLIILCLTGIFQIKDKKFFRDKTHTLTT